MKHIYQHLHLECVSLCEKKKLSLLRGLQPASLAAFSFIDEWASRIPLLLQFLCSVANTRASEMKEGNAGLCTAGAVLLSQQNIHMSALYHIAGLTLCSWKCQQNGMLYRPKYAIV